MNKARNTNVANAIAALLQPGERYAGVVLDSNNQPKHCVILLPQRADKDGSWQEQMGWAASVGGKLPNHQEAALLCANCKDVMPRKWCWLSQEYEDDSSYSWGCYPCYGDYDGIHKSFKAAAVAVRLIPVTEAV